MRRKPHVRFGGRAGETHRGQPGRAPEPDPYSEHPTLEGKLYICAVKDVCSRRIVGYAIDARMTSHLADAALRTAIARRSPTGMGCIGARCDTAGDRVAGAPAAEESGA